MSGLRLIRSTAGQAATNRAARPLGWRRSLRSTRSSSRPSVAAPGTVARGGWPVAALAAWGSLASSGACAQYETPTGSSLRSAAPADISHVDRLAQADRARATAVAFGQCVVLRYRHRVERALSLRWGEPEATKAIGGLATQDCLRNGELRMPLDLMRGAIFQGLYRTDFGKAQPALSSEKIDYRQFVTAAPEGVGIAIEFVSLHNFADCVVRADTPNSRKALLAQTGSQTESQALAALSPAFSGCFVAGTTIHFSKAMMTGLMSEALYRESRAATAMTSGEK